MSNVRMNSHEDLVNPTDNILKPQEQNFIGKDSWYITRCFSFHYFKLLFLYFSEIKQQFYVKFRPEYQSVLKNEYLWSRLVKERKKLNLYKEIFLLQRAPLIFLFLFAIIIGVAALFGSFYQRYLFTQLKDEAEHKQHPFPTSGWVFFAIIMGTGIFRFLIFNQIQNLANQVAKNIFAHLSNTYIRVLYRMPRHIQRGFLINNFFVSLDVVEQVIKLFPYWVTSIVITMGIGGFIVAIVGGIGAIVFGFTVVILLIECGFILYMFKLHQRYVHSSDRRTTLTLLNGTFMLRLLYNKIIEPFMQAIKKHRHQQANIDYKYNLSDGIIQILTQLISIFTIFILYAIREIHGQPSYFQIFEVAVLFSVFKTPAKMVGYGFASMLEGFAAMHRLEHMFHQAAFKQNDRPRQITYHRVYDDLDPNCFQGTFHAKNQTQLFIKVPRLIHQDVPVGKLTMILGKIDADPHCDQFMDNLLVKALENNESYAYIDSKPVILDGTLKQNILFFGKYIPQRYEKIVNLVHLHFNDFPQKDQTIIEHHHFQALYAGLALKIQLARALYANVDYLLINILIFKQYRIIVENIKNYRSSQHKTTVIVNLSGSFYDLADQIIILKPKNMKNRIGTYEQCKQQQKILSEFQTQYHKNQQFISQTQYKITKFKGGQSNTQQDHFNINPYNFIKFYNLSHCGASVILIILLIIPPLLELYYEVIIAQAFQRQQTFIRENEGGDLSSFDYIITLRAGVTFGVFFVMSILKIIVLALYIRGSSYLIFKRVIQKFLKSSIQSSLNTTFKKRAIDFERNIEHMDTKITSDLDFSITIIFQQITLVLFGAISDTLFLIVGIPFLIAIGVVLYLMWRYSSNIFFHRTKDIAKLSSFLNKFVYHRKKMIGYHRQQQLVSQYHTLVKHIQIHESNQNWITQALSIILQALFLVILAINMSIALSRYSELNQAFVQLSISFMIGLTNTSRIQLKVLQTIYRNLIGVSNLFGMLEQKEQLRNRLRINRVDTIEWKNFGIKTDDSQLDNLNLIIQKGQKVVVLGSKRSGKRQAFLNLLKLIHTNQVKGDIFINGIPIYEDKISRSSLAEKIYFLTMNPQILYEGTVITTLLRQFPQIEDQSSEYYKAHLIKKSESIMKQMWDAMNVQPQFQSSTEVKSLSKSCLEVYSLLRGILLQPQILVLDGGLVELDTITREKLTSWLLKQSYLNIIIDLTNRIEVIKLYNRKIQFKDGTIIHDQRRQSKKQV